MAVVLCHNLPRCPVYLPTVPWGTECPRGQHCRQQHLLTTAHALYSVFPPPHPSAYHSVIRSLGVFKPCQTIIYTYTYLCPAAFGRATCIVAVTPVALLLTAAPLSPLRATALVAGVLPPPLLTAELKHRYIIVAVPTQLIVYLSPRLH